jgi:hypothetical protein
MHVATKRADYKSASRDGSRAEAHRGPHLRVSVRFPARSIRRLGETPGIAWLNSWSPPDDNTDFGRVVDKTLSPKRTKNVESL